MKKYESEILKELKTLSKDELVEYLGRLLDDYEDAVDLSEELNSCLCIAADTLNNLYPIDVDWYNYIYSIYVETKSKFYS